MKNNLLISLLVTAVVLAGGFYYLSGNDSGQSLRPAAVNADVDDCDLSALTGTHVDDEFGLGTADRTTCLKNKPIKLVVSVGQYCRDAFYPGEGVTIPTSYACEASEEGCVMTPTGEVTLPDFVYKLKNCHDDRAYALTGIQNIINDYEKTHGMELGKDYEIDAVAYAFGGFMMKKGSQFSDEVKSLMDQGVNFHLCLNTFRKMKGYFKGGYANPLDGVMSEVNFVTAGLGAIADMQADGALYLRP